jgi:hypothetical protein
MKFYLFLGLVFLNSITINGQKLPCDFLQKSLELGIFEKHFFMGRYPNTDFLLIDTMNIFHDCNLNKVQGRQFTIQHQCLNLKDSNVILIYQVKKNRRRYEIYFLYPIENAAAMVQVYRIFGKVKAKVISYGVF